MRNRLIRLAASLAVAIAMAGILVNAMPQAFAQMSQAMAP